MINIATALDDAYAPYTYTMLLSLFSSNPEEEFRVFLLSDDLTEDSLTVFRELGKVHDAEIRLLQIDPEPFSPFLDRGWALPAAYRLKLPELLDEHEVPRLLYLDGDMIIHQPVAGFYHSDLKGKLLSACPDLTVTPNTIAFYSPHRDERINRLQREEHYFNSGCLLLDLSRWKDYSLSFYLELLQELGGRVIAPDQDLLNVAHEEDWVAADEIRYNLIAPMARDCGLEPEEVRAHNVILHYAGDKPWNGGHIHYALERFWWEYALQTPFADRFLEDYLYTSFTDKSIFQAVKEITEQNRLLSEELNATLEKTKELIMKLGQGGAG